MPFLLSAAVIGNIIAWIASTLGVGVVVFVGLSALLEQVTAYVQTAFGQLPTSALQLGGLFGVDTAFNIILSAYGINVTMMAVSRFRKL
jgi:cell division protein FtsX